MNTHLLRRTVPTYQLLHWTAEVMGGLLFAGWLALVLREMVHNGFEMPAAAAFYQAAALTLVFVGYALMGHRAIEGSSLVFVGIAAFFAVDLVTLGVPPGLQTLWFAVPGVLALLASFYRRREEAENQR